MILELANKLPPCVCRMAARKKNGYQPKSCADLARETGLDKSYISKLSVKRNWHGVSINVVDAFTRACGVNLLNPSLTIEYLMNSKKVWLRSCTASQRRFYARVIKGDQSTHRD